MKRRDFIRLTGGSAAGLALNDLACTPEKKPDSRPNIIFILSDDQGWGDIGYNGAEILTPNLDRLAGTGVRLEQHYVHPVCSPTRAALMTGRFPSRFGITGAIAGKSKQCVPLGVTTLPGLLSGCGYETHISGKWHLSLNRELGPTKFGFQSSYGYIHGQIDPYTHRYKFGDQTWHRNDVLIEEEGHVTDLITEDAIQFIRSADDKPFFLYVAYSVPHYPLAEPERWTSLYEGKIEERSRRLFAASISHMDEGIGRIVRALDQVGIREDTLVVFSSDNGGQDNWMDTEEVYDGRYPPDPVLGNNEPLRGWKTEVYEGGIRVPALVNWPGQLLPGEASSPLHVVDWLPTFAAVAGCTDGIPDNLDGQNVWEILTGSDDSLKPRPIYIKAQSGSAIRYGDWKLIESDSGELQLFNVVEDPAENTDLAVDQPEQLQQLQVLLRDQQKRDGEATFWEEPAAQAPSS